MTPPKKKQTPKRRETQAERDKASYINRGGYSHQSGRNGAEAYLKKDVGKKKTDSEKRVDEMMARVSPAKSKSVRTGVKSSARMETTYKNPDGSQSWYGEDKPKKKKK